MRSYDIKIVGVTYNNRQEVLRKCLDGQPVNLRRDFANIYDANAIAVETLAGEQLGFIPARAAAVLARQGFEPVAKIRYLAGGNEAHPTRGAVITIKSNAERLP